MFAFRGVIAIRIAVRRCRGLAKNASGVDPSPYVFYTVDGEGAAFVTDTVVHTAGRQLTCDPDFDAEPVDHPVRVGSQLHDYVRGATITFAVFDTRSEDAESNLGTTTLPLASLAESPQSTVVREAALHPSGTIEVAVSWVRC
uniref:C2 domain-containing protein n=1 Tax=Neobodo designis TaxID=312471 RepID=A0A7S1Q259_NEODS